MVAPTAIGVLTSGGDAQGMNAALRAVVRTALARGVPVYAISEGYQGMVEGGGQMGLLSWESVGGIEQRGGTIIGTARSAEFRERGAAAGGEAPGRARHRPPGGDRRRRQSQRRGYLSPRVAGADG